MPGEEDLRLVYAVALPSPSGIGDGKLSRYDSSGLGEGTLCRRSIVDRRQCCQ